MTMNRPHLTYYLKQLSKPVSLVALLIGFIGVLIGAAGLLVMARYGLLLQQLEQQAATQQATQSVTASGSTVVEGDGAAAILPVVYQVAAGDSSWQLAEQFYGNGRYYPVIERANHLQSDQWLEVGMELVIPAYSSEKVADNIEKLADVSSSASSENREKYTVVAGDSLWRIAEQQLGGGEYWPVLYRLNRSVVGANPHLVYPGAVLMLPATLPAVEQ